MLNRLSMSLGAASALAFVCVATGGVVQAWEVEVPATSNIFGAGTAPTRGAEGPAPGGGGGGTLPPAVELPSLPAGSYFSMSAVFGSVSCCGGAGGTFNGPDGGSGAGGNTNVNSFGNISGLTHNSRTMFLVGVFVGTNITQGAAPARLDFSDGGDNLEEYHPELNQSFFIGDGLFNHDELRHLEAQKFYVPAGATHFALGFVDAFSFTGDPGWYGDNVGSLTAVFGVVPTPGTAGLLAVAGLAGLRRRR